MRLFSRKRSSDADSQFGDGERTTPPGLTLNVLYGTQTGNAEELAEEIAKRSRREGFSPDVSGLDDVTMDALASMKHVLIVTSTFGDGEMPDNAGYFWEALCAENAPRLNGLAYGVLALGDTDRPQFCNAGRLIDSRLTELGAQRIVDRVDCDVEFEDDAEDWINGALPQMAKSAKLRS